MLYSINTPCYHLVITMLSPCYHHVISMLSPCYHHVISMLSPCYQHVITMLSPCYHHVITMLYMGYNMALCNGSTSCPAFRLGSHAELLFSQWDALGLPFVLLTVTMPHQEGCHGDTSIPLCRVHHHGNLPPQTTPSGTMLPLCPNSPLCPHGNAGLFDSHLQMNALTRAPPQTAAQVRTRSGSNMEAPGGLRSGSNMEAPGGLRSGSNMEAGDGLRSGLKQGTGLLLVGQQESLRALGPGVKSFGLFKTNETVRNRQGVKCIPQ